MGADKLMKTIKRYYDEFKFSHPTPNDFKRIAEKVSGMQLEWYLNDWVRTTNTIDYGVQKVEKKGEKTAVVLERIGNMPMPVEVYIEMNDDSFDSVSYTHLTLPTSDLV